MMAHIMCVQQLTPQYTSIIDRSLRIMWAKYEEKRTKNPDVDIPKPTLDDFANVLLEQKEKEAEGVSISFGNLY